MHTAFAVLTLIAFGPVAACMAGETGAVAPPPRIAPVAPDLRALLAEYAADNESVRNFYTIGRSPTRLQREDVLDAAWRARLDALDFETLDTAGRIDWLLLRNELRHADRRRAATRVKQEETAPLLPFAAEITALEEARWHLAPVDPEAAATQLDALAKAIVEQGKNVKEQNEKRVAWRSDAARLGAPTPAAYRDTGKHVTYPEAAGHYRWLQWAQESDGRWAVVRGRKELLDTRVTLFTLLWCQSTALVHQRFEEYWFPHEAGLAYLIDTMDLDRDASGPDTRRVGLDDALAALVLVNAWALTHDDAWRAPAQRSLQRLSSLRIGPDSENELQKPPSQRDLEDLTVVGWAALAMSLGRDVGLEYDEAVYFNARARLDSLTDGETGEVRPPESATEGETRSSADWPARTTQSLTALGVLSRLFDDPQLLQTRDAEMVRKGVAVIASSPPVWSDEPPEPRDLHAWYLGTTALDLYSRLHPAEGLAAWTAWNEALKKTLDHGAQGDFRGTWNPEPEPWGSRGGRSYATALQLLNSAAYFRSQTTLGWHLFGSVEPPIPRSRWTAGPCTPELALRATGEIEALKLALMTWFGHYDQFSPGFAWWTHKPYDAVIAALDDYAKLLREDIAGLKGKDEDPLVGDPIGRDALLDDLVAEMIDYTPEELLAIAEREFAWCEVQMRLAAAELGLGEDWKAALAQVKADHVAPGEQDRLVTEQAREAVAFVDAHDLVTVPDLCRETWRVRMIDADTQRTLPYAAYGGQDMLVAYPTRDMDLDTKLMTMRGNNEHFSRIVVPHELIPGHHLQGYAAARSATERDRLGTPFLVEGWALYWEMRLWELGWARSPADRIGMLFWRMHRAARIIISLKFQLGQMQPQEMIDFLVDRVGHEKVGATSEVRRYIGGGYGPLYQCAYMVGGLQLRALHDELVGGTGGRGADGNPSAGPGRINPATGARWTEREFHDAVLAQNAIPVALIRAALLTGEDAPPLTRSGAPRWRFAGEP